MPNVGRPTKYKPEYDDMIIEFAKNGCPETNLVTNDHFCDLFDCCEHSLYEWASKHESFSQAFARAQAIARRRWVDVAANNLVLNKEFSFDGRSWATILRNKMGYDNKAYIRFPDLAKTEKITDRVKLTLDYLFKGLISIEDCEKLMTTFKTAITVENEAELRPLVEHLQQELESRKK